MQLVGGHANNLDGVDLTLPLHTWTAVTGVSGSGKSTLVFDTLVREGRYRFLVATSERARRALGKLGSAAVESLTGLPVPLAVGAGRLTRSQRSTVGTLSGIAPLLRLVWARQGVGGPHGRSLFSFNSTGACPTCAGRGEVADIDAELLVVHPERSIRAGALGPTLPNGYTVYSQVTVDVLDQVCRAHGFDVDTPWSALTSAQHDVILNGSEVLEVPFGKHSLESRLKWEGITARPREMGFYRGLLPVMRDILKRTPNPGILRYARSFPCADCHGTRLGPVGRTTTVAGHTFPEVSALPLHELLPAVDALEGPVMDALRPALVDRLTLATELGLGHLALDRTSVTLSDGELQRTRLLSQLGVAMGGLLLAFDEPTLGLHPEAHGGLQRALDRLLALGNTVITVEHDPAFVTAAHRRVTLGPGAGPHGGRIVHDGPVGTLPLGDGMAVSRRRPGTGDLILPDVRQRGLATDLSLRTAALNVLMGPSGSGKSTLLYASLLPALAGERGPYGPPRGAEDLTVESVDASPIGRTPRSTVATYTGILDGLRKAWAALPEAREQGLKATHFSHNARPGRCPVCEGLGVERIGLHLMRDVERPCPVCGGDRYRPAVLAVRREGQSIADVLRLSVDAARPVLGGLHRVSQLLDALSRLGLGHLQLGRSSTTLSRGEAQRVKLAAALAHRGDRRLLLLDEPDRGLHPDDLARLLDGLHSLVDAGHTVVAISHRPAMWHAADHLLEVRDGRCRTAEPPAVEARRPTDTDGEPPAVIRLTGVRTHTLRDLDVTLPHGKLTAVCGPSGSGKSSLVFDTLVAEADRRFAETLPFEVRRYLRRLPTPDLDAAEGLTPTVALRQDAPTPDRRSTVGTTTGLGPLLRLLFAREGTLDGVPHPLSASHFARSEPLGRCDLCAGRRTVPVVDPDRLVTHPERSIRAGALHGTKPGRFFAEDGGRHLALLGALVDLDTPWNALSTTARDIALHGRPDVLEVTWSFTRGRRSGEHALEEPWPGFVSLVTEEAAKRAKRKDAADWWAPFVQIPCTTCGGAGLQAPARDIRWNGQTFAALSALPLADLHDQLTGGPTALRPLVDRCLDLVHGLRSMGVEPPADTPMASLSPSARQRTRLAGVLTTGLTGLTVVLDEPDAGLGAAAVDQLVRHLHAVRDAGNTVVVVSHAPAVLEAADHLVELGPGAGPDGGRVVATGADVLTGSGPTATALRRPRQPVPAGIAIVTDPAALRARAHDLGVPITMGPSGTTLAYALGWMRPLQKAFAAIGPLPAKAFSHHSPAGRCPTCKGTGEERVALDVLADLALPCPTCDGRRYTDEILAVTLHDHGIDQVLAGPLGRLPRFVPAVAPAVQTAVRLGLGHLPVGVSLARVSGGERQRLGILAAVSDRPSALVLDDPTRGLHPSDLPGLLHVLDDLSDTTTVVLGVPDPARLGGWSPPSAPR